MSDFPILSDSPLPTPLRLWVDADALPNMLKEIILRASDRFQLHVYFVANQALAIPRSQRIHFIQVLAGADEADKHIIARVNAHDLVITQDIPLAHAVIEKGGIAIHPRGEIYTRDNIKARLHLRDFMDHLRNSGVQTGGVAAMSERDKRQFANALEQSIRQQLQQQSHFTPSRENL